MPPDQQAKMGRNRKGFTYQFGGPPDKAGEGTFGATGGQVFYVPDKPNDPGVDRIETYSWGCNCITTKPEHVWWGGAHPEPAVLRKDWRQVAGGPLGQPHAMGRSHSTWSNDAVMIFSTGFVGTVGNQTSDDRFACMLFPRHKVPTAVAVTNRNEFALFTIWDTQICRGQVAVVALEALGLPFHSWRYMGLPNGGSYSSLKLLGYVDLPGSAAPTAIYAAGNNIGGMAQGNKMLSELKLDSQDVRDSFYKGPDKGIISSAGLAVVAARHENKVAFVDLQPLFEFMRTMYLTTPENFGKTKARGPEPKQWPYTFEVEPRATPQVAAVVSQPNPTAVLAGTRPHHGDSVKAYVASLDGRIGIYHVGGLATEAVAKPDDVRCVGMVQAGRNPCAMAFLRNGDPQIKGSSPYEYNATFAVVCRGDRELDWVHVTGVKGEVYRRLRDSRLLDPVALDFCERAYLVSVADFKGRKVINYLMGPTPSDHMRPARSVGPGAEGKDDYKCGGFMEFPGYVYNVSTASVNY
jgi:hypothetical protein